MWHKIENQIRFSFRFSFKYIKNEMNNASITCTDAL